MTFSGDWFYWLILLGVCAANVVLVYLAWWALFSDRAKSRRRCPRCWYDLAYSPGMTCGECGFTARIESQFHRTRRRYWVATFAIASSVFISGYVSDQLSQKGWVSMMPTRVLLTLLPLASDFNSSIAAEIVNRASTNQLSDEQWVELLDRCVRGDWQAKPGTEAWAGKYGAFITRWRQDLIYRRALEQKLEAIPAQLRVTTRDVWPLGSKAVAQVQLNDWWPWGMECRIRAVPRAIDNKGQIDAAAPAVTFYRTGDDRFSRGEYPLTLPVITASTRKVEIDFAIDRRRMQGIPGREDQPAGQWEPALTQTVTLPVRAQGAVSALLNPVDLPEQTSALQQAFADGVVRFPSGRSPVRFRLELLHSFNAPFDDVAMGVNMLLYHEDVLARQLDVWWLGGTDPADRKYGFEVAYENRDLLPLADGQDQKWHMIIRGDPNLALRVGAGTKYWAGEFDVPVEVVQHTRPAPRRAWWTEAETGEDASLD